jgi:hypothetical protein
LVYTSGRPFPNARLVPDDAHVKVTNGARLVSKLAGEELYGEDSTVPLRELIQNSADAVRATRVLQQRDVRWGISLSGWEKTVLLALRPRGTLSLWTRYIRSAAGWGCFPRSRPPHRQSRLFRTHVIAVRNVGIASRIRERAPWSPADVVVRRGVFSHLRDDRDGSVDCLLGGILSDRIGRTATTAGMMTRQLMLFDAANFHTFIDLPCSSP